MTGFDVCGPQPARNREDATALRARWRAIRLLLELEADRLGLSGAERAERVAKRLRASRGLQSRELTVVAAGSLAVLRLHGAGMPTEEYRAAVERIRASSVEQARAEAAPRPATTLDSGSPTSWGLARLMAELAAA